MNKNKKICVIGAGKWGINHIRTLYDLGCLGGVVESCNDKRLLISNLYKNIDVFDNLDDSFSQNYDGYTIATPASTHFEIAKNIINNGFHVLIEKPMTLNTVDAKKLIDLSNSFNVNVMVGHLLLFHPAIQKIKELIDSRKIGDLQYISTNRLNFGTVRTEENVFWSFAPHDISILQYLTEDFPLDVKIFGGNFLQSDISDTTLTMLEYSNNIKAHIYLSWIHPFKEHRIVIIGSKGMLTYEDSSHNKELLFYDKKYIIEDDVPKKIDGQTEKILYDKKLPLTEELKYFINHLDANKKIKISGINEGYEVVRILEIASQKLEQINKVYCNE